MKTKHHPILSAPVIRGGRKNLTNAIRRKWSARALGGVLVASVLAVSPSLLAADCTQWNTGGDWFPRGGGNNVSFHLTDRFGVITGLATQGTAPSAKVSGNVIGRAFSLDVPAKGLFFHGEIGSNGMIHGNVADSAKGVTSFWTSSRAMKCTTQYADPAKPTSKPEKSLSEASQEWLDKEVSKRKAAPPNPSAANPAAPGITASPANAAGGSTTLTWDGGPEHPYAEVWVAVDGEDPTFVVEQGKGSRRVTVEPGKTYRYILTDSGKDLSTVTVRGK